MLKIKLKKVFDNLIKTPRFKFKNLFKLKSKNNKKNMEKTKFDAIYQLIWITPAMTFVCLFTLYAIFIVFKSGFNGAARNDEFSWTLVNFKIVSHDKSFQIAILNSILYAFIALPSSLILSLFVGKALSSILNKRLFSFLQTLFFMPFVTTSIAVAMTFSMIFSNDSNSFFNQIVIKFKGESIDWKSPFHAKLLLLIYGLWKMLPFQIIMFTSAFMKVNKKLYQASAIDGLTSRQQFWKISLPQIMPMIIYMITTGMIGAFKFMPFGLFANYAEAQSAGVQTVVYYIFHYTREAVNHGRAAAASIMLLSIILFMAIFNRYLVKFLKRRYY